MFSEYFGYILQGITILITLSLGLVTSYQTKKLQHGKNIISVTTNYRMKRCEQLKECGQKLMANSAPELLDLNYRNSEMLYEAYTAAETISMILHRHFNYDKELIDLSAEIVKLAILYNKHNDNRAYNELEYKRRIFRIKCDIYTTADWNRIKSETEGKNTSSQSWYDYYEKIAESFKDEILLIENEYKKQNDKLFCKL